MFKVNKKTKDANGIVLVSLQVNAGSDIGLFCYSFM